MEEVKAIVFDESSKVFVANMFQFIKYQEEANGSDKVVMKLELLIASVDKMTDSEDAGVALWSIYDDYLNDKMQEER